MKNKVKLLFSIIIGFVMLFGYLITDSIFKASLQSEVLYTACSFGLRILVYFAGYFLVKKLYGIRFSLSTKNFATAISIYKVFFLIIIVSLLIFQTPSDPIEVLQKSFLAALPSLALAFVHEMGTGIAEEVVCRGIFFNAFRKSLGNTKSGFWASMILSSLLFGLIHLLNLTHQPISYTLAQVIYATMFGFVFCMIYYQSKSLLPCIILHGVVDFFYVFWECFPAASSRINPILAIIICLPGLIIAIIQFNQMFRDNKKSVPVIE